MNEKQYVTIELPLDMVERLANETNEENVFLYKDFSTIGFACRTTLKVMNKWKNS
jgi:hypothetical protein